jgi:FtsH-binding integral membrane protein
MRDEAYQLDSGFSAAQAVASERAAFIQRVYMHLAGAVLALVALDGGLLSVLQPETKIDILRLMMGSQLSWLVVVLLFMGAGFVAQMWAQSRTSVAMQYAGLALYTVCWAVLFLPLLIIAEARSPDLIPQAGILTGAVFGGLTLSVFVTRKDYSFLGPVISIGTLIALGVIIAGMIFGFTLDLFFCFAMVALMSASILYNTSKVMLHYPTDMYVAAALELLADVALLFWYILQILMILNSNRD